MREGPKLASGFELAIVRKVLWLHWSVPSPPQLFIYCPFNLTMGRKECSYPPLFAATFNLTMHGQQRVYSHTLWCWNVVGRKECTLYPRTLWCLNTVGMKLCTQHSLMSEYYSRQKRVLHPCTFYCPIIFKLGRKECTPTLFPAWKMEARSKCTPTLNLAYACLPTLFPAH